ncbi:MAG: SPOR domain-containing protein [Xanthomonadales bacterium]
MAAARRKSSGRSRGATRGRTGAPGWIWLLAGMLVGLGFAWYLFAKGYIPQPAAERVETESQAPADGTGDEEIAPAREEPKKSRYDFFTVLPEMEVVVPEAELNERTRAQTRAESSPDAGSTTARPATSADQYLLQVGSFRAAGDAEQMKARLALLGISARVQSVTVNDAAWHRVRVGPVNGAREAEAMRRRLADNGIDSLVMKNP